MHLIEYIVLKANGPVAGADLELLCTRYRYHGLIYPLITHSPQYCIGTQSLLVSCHRNAKDQVGEFGKSNKFLSKSV